MTLNHGDLIKEWPAGQLPILWVCQLLNGPVQTHLEEGTGSCRPWGSQILLALVIPDLRRVPLVVSCVTLLAAQRNRYSKLCKEYEQTLKGLSPLTTKHLQRSCTRLPECSN